MSSRLLSNRVNKRLNKPGSSLTGPNLITLDESEEIDMGDDRESVSNGITPMKIMTDGSSRVGDNKMSMPPIRSKQKRAVSLVPGAPAVGVGPGGKYALRKQQSFLPDLDLPGSARSGESETGSASKSSSYNRAEINYDELTGNKHGDLSKLVYTNDLEKHLITRIYSNVNKLSSVLGNLSSCEDKMREFLTTPDSNECLPLYYAIKSDCLNAVRILVEAGSPLDRTTNSGDPAPHLACLLGVSLALIDYLLSLESGDPKALYKTDQEGWTILHCASNEGHLDVVKYLIEKKFMNPNVKDSKFRYTSLQLATINNRMEVINYYLSFVCQASIRPVSEPMMSNPNRLNILPLMTNTSDEKEAASTTTITPLLTKREKLGSARKLYSFPQPSSISYYKDERRLSREMSMSNVYTNVVIDLSSQNSEGQNVLHSACRFGRFEVVEILLKKYGSSLIDVNVLDYKGRTCLDWAYYWLSGLNSYDEFETNKASIVCDLENSFYVQRNMLIIDEKIESEIKLIHLLTRYGAKFSNFAQFLYDMSPLREFERLDRAKVDLNPFEEPNVRVNKHMNEIAPIRTHLRVLAFVLKLNLPTMILNMNERPNEQLSVNLIRSRDSSALTRLQRHSTETGATLMTTTSQSDLDIGNLSILKMKTQLVGNLNSLSEFIQRTVIDSFEKQFYFEQIQSLLDLIERF